ncbi:DoxX family protein [Rhodoferax aquaticus]|uniref:DoxX family protein n=1 Tax=Rhodoferax aquaticus TaxID=2527691 RepID=A0A515EVA0_9BURK|nr:DoxX family protein [Rhodoferax aquaticus]QDL56568.1 DoxX family protein [Rhodoferax aquaticus]
MNAEPNPPSNLSFKRSPAKQALRSLGVLWEGADYLLDSLQPLLSLLARIYVAQVFFSSGLTKLRDWGTTVALFTDEYQVPLLPPELAAVLGTFGEVALPVLLVLGLGGRFAALGLSCVNIVAVLSLMDIAPAALQQHITWGVLLLGLAVFGCGKWSTDRWLKPYVVATKR